MKFLSKGSSWVIGAIGVTILVVALPGTDLEPADLKPSPSYSQLQPGPSATPVPTPTQTETAPVEATKKSKALRALEKIPVKGRAPKTGYTREAFASEWEYFDGCDTRNRILKRDFESFSYRSDSSCIIEYGILEDPYTGETIRFTRGVTTSLEVQIDHVVALSDAWQKGAQRLSGYERNRFYNDPLNLLAVAGSANLQKGDSDAASWLPSNKSFRCKYVARQIAVKMKYGLWVTQAEKESMQRVLRDCPTQKIPSS